MTETSVGPTPPHDDEPTGIYVHYIPHDMKYSAEFEDSLIQVVLDSPDKQDNGIKVILEDSDECPVDGASVRAQDISPESLPTLTESDLPLPLDDARRKFASPIAGVNLTHPNGYLEGGPGLEPSMDTFPDDFLSNNPNITNSDQLQKAVKKEIDASIEALKERMEARQKAKDRNEQITKEIKMLTDQHDMELRLQQRMQEEQRKKKEAREKRRNEKDSAG
ncbi:hypothetical protein LTR37_000208 [Vermiconidia calcicola]|uniref:Uncharacterized protein n=1 Tax=Vermiconidia calcicola TaxID=1690605 RepID=A0ACC3P088_9PEZI|nr:hypothetical protein LTR37_000208 [Vermiconidia calcicola]